MGCRFGHGRILCFMILARANKATSYLLQWPLITMFKIKNKDIKNRGGNI
jgi:hypothetical protein